MDLRNIHLQQKKQHRHGFSLIQQLFLALREKILSQQLLVGSRLPASRILAKDLGVSRNTVNSVYEQLRAEGYVNSREGSGFYISEQLPQFDRSPHIALSLSHKSYLGLSFSETNQDHDSFTSSTLV